ncbi:MAG: hypothetical protein C7B45_09555 [Sulfobacillus acidophilus]|uniref:Solute-binding protein family 5 domain-containing protein n=1 Tax=Sulfobacillus acidophilus TaxID=53633 RepID=A0A2T2WHK7_9FIRM|nr:MAG: hypothetical protein C7B45_09555 [Sulfobacillus acidophilus]
MKSSTIGAASLALATLVSLIGGCGAPSLHLRSSFVYNTILSVDTPRVTNLDPVTGDSGVDQLYDQIVFQTLLALNPAGKPQPQLAVSWHHNTHSTLWQIALNPSAKWWTGRPITANDVVWTLNFYRNRASGFVRSQELHHVSRVEAVSPTELKIWLDQPDPSFAQNILSTHGGLWILPSFLLDHLPVGQVQRSDYLTKLKDVVGSGPFRPFHLSSRALTWVANPHYFLGTPRIKYMRWVWNPSLTTLAHENDVDLAWTFRPSRAFGTHYHTVPIASPTVWGIVVQKRDMPVSILKRALRPSKLPGLAVSSLAAPNRTPLKQLFAHWGYHRRGTHWVKRHGAAFSVSIAGPRSGFGHTLVQELDQQWGAQGIIVHVLPPQMGHEADLMVESMAAPPFSSTPPPRWWRLVRSVEYWHAKTRLTDWQPNIWQPLYKVEDWRMKSRHNS